MEPVFAMRTTLELAIPPVVVFPITLLALRLVRRVAPKSSFGTIRSSVVVLIGSAQLLIYVALFAAAFELGENRGAIPGLLAALVAVLGAPLMYLSTSVDSLFCPSVRAETALFALLASLNAMVWGVTLAWLLSVTRRGTHVA